MSAKKAASRHWFFTPFDAAPPELPYEITVEDKALAHHIKHVVRLMPEDEVVLVNQPQQQPYIGVLKQVQKDRITAVLIRHLPTPPRKPPFIIAAVSLIKGPKWDWVLQKLTELGVAEVIPLRTRRTVVDIKNPADKQERWLEIVKHAAAQSEQACLPVVHPPQSLKNLLETANTYDSCLKLVAVERSNQPYSDFLSSDPVPHNILYAIGPEGGWDLEETQLLQHGGFHAVSVGDKILRSETAAIYLASVLDYVYHQKPYPPNRL